MRAQIKAWLGAAILCAFASVAHAAPSAQDILVASDAVRNPEYPFGLTNTLIEYRGGKQTLVAAAALVGAGIQRRRGDSEPGAGLSRGFLD